MLHALIIIGCWKHETICAQIPNGIYFPIKRMIIHIFLNMHLSLIFEQTCEPLLGSDPSVEIHSHAIQIENDYDNMCRNMIISNDQSKMFTWHERKPFDSRLHDYGLF